VNGFNELCWNLLKKIPSGKVTTYRDIAKALGTKAYRAVGNAMNKNPRDTSIYPCHRVIRSSGQVGGYAKGSDAKVSRLRSEGVEIINGIIDLDKYGFNFGKH